MAAEEALRDLEDAKMARALINSKSSKHVVDKRDLERFKHIKDPSLLDLAGPPPEAQAKEGDKNYAVISEAKRPRYDLKELSIAETVEKYKITWFYPNLHRRPNHILKAAHFISLENRRKKLSDEVDRITLKGYKLGLDSRHYRNEFLSTIKDDKGLVVLSKTYQFDDCTQKFHKDWTRLGWRPQPWPGVPLRWAIDAVTVGTSEQILYSDISIVKNSNKELEDTLSGKDNQTPTEETLSSNSKETAEEIAERFLKSNVTVPANDQDWKRVKLDA